VFNLTHVYFHVSLTFPFLLLDISRLNHVIIFQCSTFPFSRRDVFHSATQFWTSKLCVPAPTLRQRIHFRSHQRKSKGDETRTRTLKEGSPSLGSIGRQDYTSPRLRFAASCALRGGFIHSLLDALFCPNH
jgi:hypothetical protein